MRDIKPVIAVATLMAAVIGEGWLRSKVHQFDEDYVGVCGLMGGMAAQISGRGRPPTLRSSPKPPTRAYRTSSVLSSGPTMSFPAEPRPDTIGKATNL